MTRTTLTDLYHWTRRNVEMSFLVIGGLIVIAVWILAELSDEVIEGETRDLDTRILLMLRAPGDVSNPIGPAYLEEIGRDLTALGGVAVITLITLMVAGFFLLARQWRTAVYMLATVGGGVLVSGLAKSLFDRPRPDLVPHGSMVYTSSFPSGHSMMAAVAFLTLGVLIARLQDRRSLKIYVMAVAVFLTLLVGVSRVYLGVHWPTDVAAGWLAGGAWAMICLAIARVLGRSGVIERDADGH